MFTKTLKVPGGERATRFDLARDATLRLPRPRRGAVVEVERGLVLVTREGDGEDHVLSSGMSFSLEGRGLAVAWALAPSTLRVRARPARREGAPATAQRRALATG